MYRISRGLAPGHFRMVDARSSLSGSDYSSVSTSLFHTSESGSGLILQIRSDLFLPGVNGHAAASEVAPTPYAGLPGREIR